MLLSAGGRYGCPRVRALSALAWRVDGALLAFWVDGLPAADSQRTRVTRSAPPVRSAATAHAPPAPARSSGCHPSTPASPHRTTNRQSKAGAATTEPGGRHNRRPTGGVLLCSKPIRCNDYPTSAVPTEAPKEANPQKGFLGQRPKPTFGDFCLDTKVTRARGRETSPPRSGR